MPTVLGVSLVASTSSGVLDAVRGLDPSQLLSRSSARQLLSYAGAILNHVKEGAIFDARDTFEGTHLLSPCRYKMPEKSWQQQLKLILSRVQPPRMQPFSGATFIR